MSSKHNPKDKQAKLAEVAYLATDQGDDEGSVEAPGSQRLIPVTHVKEPETVSVEDEVIDSAFGWVVVAGGFLTQMINVGLMRTDGIYFLQFRERFHESAQLCAWPGAMSLTIQSFMGPFATALCNRYSVRTTVILATVFNVLGLALSGVCTDIRQLFFTYGILQGIGRGLTITPGIFIVNMYFNKMRARAIGVSMAGAGLGTFAMVPLHQWFFETLGFTNAYLMIATIATSGFLAAALFRPLSMHVEMKKAQKLRERTMSKHYTDIAKDVLAEGVFGEGKARNSWKQSDKEVEKLLKNKTKPASTRSHSKAGYDQLTGYESFDTINKPSRLKSILNTCFPIEYSRTKEEKKGEKRKIFHFELFKDVPFLILCACMVFFNLGNKNVFSFLPALGTSKGLNQSEASLLISAVGIGDIIGRFSAGFIMDQPWVVPEIFYGGVLFVCAGAAVVMTCVNGFVWFSLAGAVYGCFGGVSISQKTTLLNGILGKELLTSSFGIMYSFQGFGTLTGPPISGALRDSLGAYDYAFYLTAACMFFSGILFVVSCLLFAARKRRKKKGREGDEEREALWSSESAEGALDGSSSESTNRSSDTDAELSTQYESRSPSDIGEDDNDGHNNDNDRNAIH